MLIFFLVVLSLPTVGYFVMQQKSVQDYVAHKITTKISAFIGAPVTLDGVSVNIFSTISFHHFCVKSPHLDTILYTPELSFRINTFTLSSHFLEFKKVTMEKPDIHFYVDSAGIINFQFIIDKLASKDTTPAKHPMVVSFGDVTLKDANFTLKNYYRTPKEFGIDFSNIHLNPLNIKVSNFRIDRGVSLNIRSLSFKDKSGFQINKLSGQFKLNQNNMIYNNLTINTPFSNIEARQVHFQFKSTKELKPRIFGKNVGMTINVKPSDVSTDDIRYFLPFFKDYHLKTRISGDFNGVLSDLKGRNINVTYSKQTKINSDINIVGLPDLASSFLHINIKNLYTTPSDIESIRLPGSKYGRIVLPDNFRHISFITYRGKFTGFTNDFVAYGTFTSNLGKIDSDLALKPDTANYINFSGKVKAYPFDIGTFIDRTDLMGNISLNAMVNGAYRKNENLKARLDGLVSSFYFKKYNYQNIKVAGTLSHNTYDGSLSIDDPNIGLDFLGKVDLSKQKPVFNFTANVKRAWLNRLNLDPADSGSFVACNIASDFEGDSIDNLTGNLKIEDLTLLRGKKELHINQLLVLNSIADNTGHLTLLSDPVDAEITGKYKFSELVQSARAFAHNYLPSLFRGQVVTPPNNNHFDFKADFKDSRQLTDFLVPGLYISQDSKLTGTYAPAGNNLVFRMDIPLLQHKNKKWYNFFANGQTNQGLFTLSTGCDNFLINNKLSFKNLVLNSLVKLDSVKTNIVWDNKDTSENRGNFTILAALTPSLHHPKPLITLNIKPSELFIKDTVWNIQSGPVAIDSSNIYVSQLLISHDGQFIKINGNLSKNPEIPLSIAFNNVDLGNLNSFIYAKNFTLGGTLNGQTDLFNLYQNPVFHASLKADSLSLNKQPLGNLLVGSVYSSSENQIKINASLERENFRALDIKGTYSTLSQELNFDIGLNKLRAEAFGPYIANIFSDVHGIATGDLTLTGTIKDPQLNGPVKIQKGSFVVNYLKTKHNFDKTIDINKNTFLFKNVEVFDRLGNKAVVNGQIEYRKLKDLYINITADTKKFECLNTTEKDNNLFFGTGYGTGRAIIKGNPKEISMDITATTENPSSDNRTIIAIPLTTKADVSESDFIRIVNKRKEAHTFSKYEIDKTTNNNQVTSSINTSFKLNINLNVTPDAEAQIVFDPKIGDVIKGKGSSIGNLNMTMENGNFNMYGTYRVEKGDYLFTLQNIYNRKFDINEGGTITWNGNPMDAVINIEASYNKVKVLGSEILGSTASSDAATKKIPIECKLFLTGKLMNPNIEYDIIPQTNDIAIQSALKNSISTADEKSKQFLSLLIAGTYMNEASSSSGSSPLGYTAARSTGIEFLSNQLSRMLSQASKDFDIGFNYRPGDQVTTDEVELAISKQFLNDRITINGNFDVGGTQVSKNSTNNTSGFIGEGNVEFKPFANNNKIRLKAFNRSNQNSVYELSPYTQGVGILYKEDFSSLKELVNRYYRSLFGKKEKQPKPVEEKSDEDNP
ncbi:MAG: translocation/assembly module TamB domain-containing protein [Bacteroidota bacterium]|nr:translocation/assembly module TamB domain-containing protein [Bacteroidota bacterium]